MGEGERGWEGEEGERGWEGEEGEGERVGDREWEEG